MVAVADTLLFLHCGYLLPYFSPHVSVFHRNYGRLPDTSHTEQFILFGHFACKKWETLIAFELSKSHLQFGDLFVSLRLLFEVWRVKSVRLMSNQSRNIWVWLITASDPIQDMQGSELASGRTSHPYWRQLPSEGFRHDWLYLFVYMIKVAWTFFLANALKIVWFVQQLTYL